MALVQIGYLGRTGPVFTDDSPGGGKKVLLQAFAAPSPGLYAKTPAYGTNLGLNAADYTLGSYSDSQRVTDIPAFKQPAGGVEFDGFDTNVGAMVSATTIPGNGGAVGGGGTTPAGGTTPSGGTTPAGGTTPSGGTVPTPVDTTYKAPTVTEQITTFLSNYWWLVLLIVGFLLWKPVIAPALGLDKKKRSYR